MLNYMQNLPPVGIQGISSGSYHLDKNVISMFLSTGWELQSLIKMTGRNSSLRC